MNLKQWKVASLDRDRAAKIAEEHALPSFLAMMLELRGFREPEEIEAMLGGSLSDPYLMKDMDKAVARIRRALDGFERIAVYGDYDADGVTATAMLYSYLQALGADVLYYIPQREGEGYGMNPGAVRHLKEQGVSLILTVDNGISSVEEVALARELGMDVVITDHHRPHETVPQAAAVVDAWQEDDHSPFQELCGAGVALKLLIALEDGDERAVLGEYAELAALGTVGDVVPVVGENRLIVREGIRQMRRSPSPGVAALLERCSGGQEITATGLAFTLIPRLNATGRMGTPQRAVQLLIADDDEEAGLLAEEICADNDRRRQVEAEIAREAARMLEEDPALKEDRVMVVAGRGWHHGVIGIVAARITERYGKPCFVVSVDDESAKGSGRSVEGFSLFAAVSHAAPVLERYGGHPMAAGATMKAENVAEFRRLLNEYAASRHPEMPAPVLQLDCRLNPAALSEEMPRSLRRLEPFGSGNPQPLFGLYGMELREIVPVGGGNHLRLVCQKNGAFLNCMRFGVKPQDFPYHPGDRLDLAVTLDLREYRGEERLSVTVRDLRPVGLDDEGAIRSLRAYERLRRGEPVSRGQREMLAPGREQLAALYRMLQARKAEPLEPLQAAAALPGFSLGMLLLALDMMEEQGLICRRGSEESVSVQLIPVAGKVDIFAAKAYLKLEQLTKEG